MTQILYSFNFNCGRMGGLSGLFVSTAEQIESLEGREIYFGEVLGKHSEIVCEFDDSLVEEKSRDQEFIEKLVSVTGGHLTIAGFNPFDYIDEGEL